MADTIHDFFSSSIIPKTNKLVVSSSGYKLASVISSRATALNEGKIGEKGTLVLWTKIDQANVKKPLTLVKRLKSELCRAYRHYLGDDDDYGTRRCISVHTYHLGK